MGVINQKTYCKYLSSLLNKADYIIEYDKYLKLNLYLTLLSLSGLKYQKETHQEEINIIEDYLRKINNLKIKIQLKRKDYEIDTLLNEIEQIHINNQDLITKYNKERLNIIDILKEKEPKHITTIIDSLTKQKNNNINEQNNDNKLRINILNNILKNDYNLIDDTISIDNTEISLNIHKFYSLFDYLLNSNNYQKPFNKESTNNNHISLINNIIDTIKKETFIDDTVIIPLILVYIITKNIQNYEIIPTNDFHINNIKIAELYSLANKNNNVSSLKWQNIQIPNEYLYQKIKEIITKGTYYFENNQFVLEQLPDFKISIDISNMKKFLKQNIKNIISK